MISTPHRHLSLLRAHGRCTGALIFSVFGGGWLGLSCAYFHRFSKASAGLIAAGAFLLAAQAWRMQKGHPVPVLDEALRERKKADDRTFGLINAVTYSMVFLLFLVLPKFGRQNYIFPGFVALVGLHFLPLPALYQHRANQVTGGFLIGWAIFCAIAFQADGNRMAAFVALGAGVALWSSSVWALVTARRLLRRSPAAEY